MPSSRTTQHRTSKCQLREQFRRQLGRFTLRWRRRFAALCHRARPGADGSACHHSRVDGRVSASRRRTLSTSTSRASSEQPRSRASSAARRRVVRKSGPPIRFTHEVSPTAQPSNTGFRCMHSARSCLSRVEPNRNRRRRPSQTHSSLAPVSLWTTLTQLRPKANERHPDASGSSTPSERLSFVAVCWVYGS